MEAEARCNRPSGLLDFNLMSRVHMAGKKEDRESDTHLIRAKLRQMTAVVRSELVTWTLHQKNLRDHKVDTKIEEARHNLSPEGFKQLHKLHSKAVQEEQEAGKRFRDRMEKKMSEDRPADTRRNSTGPATKRRRTSEM